jgi:cardiolipin synthase
MFEGGWQIISAVLYIMNLSLAVYAATSMIMRRQDPVKTLTWVTVLILLPYFGLVLYFFFGMHYRKKRLYSFKGDADYRLRKEISAQQAQIIKENPQLLGNLEPYSKMIFQNLRNSHNLIENNSSIDFYFSGREALDAMFLAMEAAKWHIHLQSYIFEDDQTGRRFAQLLMLKAQQGVEVRVIYDGVGSMHLKKDFVEMMEAAGVEMLCYSKVTLLLPTSKLNYRNHRKILVVDGKTGFLGGVNIADRYYYGNDLGVWHDTHMKITGEAVFTLQTSFFLDRYFILNRKIRRRKKYFPQLDFHKQEQQGAKKIATQTVACGPDSNWASIMQCFFSAITLARKHIYIVSPYFTPNESILNAIKIAALGNIDVRIMLPDKSDTLLAHYSTRSYIAELLEAGVKIYLFKKGFNHSKVVSIDEEFCIVGSANMDMRSFEHNFEILSVIYDKGCAATIERQFLDDAAACTQLHKGKWAKRETREKVAESIARLCSPLL